MFRIIVFFLAFSLFKINAQNAGKVVVYTSLNQPFLISLNGVRVVNQYNTKFTFEALEDNDYKARIWFQGAQFPINFNIQSAPGYESVFQLNKDQYGAYTLNLISKVLMGVNPITTAPSVTTTQTPPVVSTPTVPVIKEMEAADFNDRLKTVEKESFDDGKLEKARFVFDKEYFSSSQAAKVTQLFSFDDRKVEFAKFAYKRTVDKKNYYKVVDILTFDRDKKELQEWIKKNP